MDDRRRAKRSVKKKLLLRDTDKSSEEKTTFQRVFPGQLAGECDYFLGTRHSFSAVVGTHKACAIRVGPETIKELNDKENTLVSHLTKMARHRREFQTKFTHIAREDSHTRWPAEFNEMFQLTELEAEKGKKSLQREDLSIFSSIDKIRLPFTRNPLFPESQDLGRKKQIFIDLGLGMKEPPKVNKKLELFKDRLNTFRPKVTGLVEQAATKGKYFSLSSDQSTDFIGNPFSHKERSTAHTFRTPQRTNRTGFAFKSQKQRMIETAITSASMDTIDLSKTVRTATQRMRIIGEASCPMRTTDGGFPKVWKRIPIFS